MRTKYLEGPSRPPALLNGTFHGVLPPLCPVPAAPVDLLHAKTAQRCVSKQIFLIEVEEEIGIRIRRKALDVALVPPRAELVLWKEAGGDELDGARRSNDAVAEQPIVNHADAHGPALQEILTTKQRSIRKGLCCRCVFLCGVVLP